MKRLILFIILALALLSAALCLIKLNQSQITSRIMGCNVTIIIKDKNPRPHLHAALARLREIEKLLNRYDENSEVSRLNRGEKFTLSDDTERCLALAEAAKKITSGTFNARYSGKLNLDGIGKGYAVEEARRLLFKRGVKNAMINMRSSIAVLGGPWKIGIQHPRKKDEIMGKIVLKDGQALSTSGDYEQGRHIIDPKSGKPASACQAVTVVYKDAGMADALSTGIFVLGPQKGLELAKKLGLGVLIVDASGRVTKYNL